MFRPMPMIQVDVLLLQRDLSDTVRALAAAGILHLQPAARGLGRPSPAPAADRNLADDCQRLATRITQLLERLHIPKGAGNCVGLAELPLWERRVAELAARVGRVNNRRSQLLHHRTALLNLDLFLSAIADIDIDVEELRSLRQAHLAAGMLSPRNLDLLQAAPIPMELLTAPAPGQETLTAILVSRRRAPQLKNTLQSLNFRPLELPEALYGSPSVAQQRLQRLRGRVEQRLDGLEAKLAAMAVENRAWLLDRLWTLDGECRLLQARNDFDYTERTAILSGWLPAKRLGDLRRVLQGQCGERFAVRRLQARGDRIPVQFRNPFLIRPFEKLLSVYGVPSYEEIEPTPLLAFGFLLMFGMMFADVGQGLLLVVTGLLVYRYSRFRDQGLLVAELGAFATLFGLLFGSCFGSEELFAPLWFSPLHNLPLLMGCALSLGVALILTGLALRFVNGLRREKAALLLTDRFGLAGLVFYGGAVTTALLVHAEVFPAAALWWLALPLGAIYLHPLAETGFSLDRMPVALLEGAIEVLETVLGFLANTFSFLRVAAFGLAHVGLSMAVFAVADAVKQAPLGLLWVALVHVAGNLIIVALEGLVVSVQTVRLEFYEFFSKFFRGGGVAYRPLTLHAGTERRI